MIFILFVCLFKIFKNIDDVRCIGKDELVILDLLLDQIKFDLLF